MSAVIVVCLACATVYGCGSEQDSAPDPDSSGAAHTDVLLLEAYAALEAVAAEVPQERLPPRRVRGEVENIGPGESVDDLDDNREPADRGLFNRWAEHGDLPTLAYFEDQRERDLARGGLVVRGATNEVLLLVSEELGRASASELLEGGATFAALAPDGELYCIDDAERGVEPCPLPESLRARIDQAAEEPAP